MITPTFSLVFFIGFATSVPAGVRIDKDGTVGASFGGYSASAGLGGIVGEGGTRGGLHAEAGAPSHFAAAGLGGSTISQNPGAQGQLYATAGRLDVPAHSQAQSASQSQASVFGSSPSSSQTNVFDDIFNIPISALGAVNQYLNNRKKVEVQQIPQNSKPALGSPTGTQTNVNPEQHNTRTKYDDIFNIPISVLNSVNRFLNGK